MMKTKKEILEAFIPIETAAKIIADRIQNTPDDYHDSATYTADKRMLEQQLTAMGDLKKYLEEVIEQDALSISSDSPDLKETFERLHRKLDKLMTKLSSLSGVASSSLKSQDSVVKTAWQGDDEPPSQEKWENEAQKTLASIDELRQRVDASKAGTQGGETMLSFKDISDSIQRLKKQLSQVIKKSPCRDDDPLKSECHQREDSLYVLGEEISALSIESSGALLALETQSGRFESHIHTEKSLIPLRQKILAFQESLQDPSKCIFTEHKARYDALIDKCNNQLAQLDQKITQQIALFKIQYIDPIEQNLEQLNRQGNRNLFLLDKTIALLNEARDTLRSFNNPDLNASYLSFITDKIEKTTQLRDNYARIQSYISAKLSKSEKSKGADFFRTCLTKIQNGDMLSLGEIKQLYSKKGYQPGFLSSADKDEFKKTLKILFEQSCPFLNEITQKTKKHPIDLNDTDIIKIQSTLPKDSPLIDKLRQLMTGETPTHSVLSSSSSPSPASTTEPSP